MSSDQNHSHLEPAAASDESLREVHAELSHRKPEKPDGNPVFPLVLLGLMCLAIFVGSIYLAHYSSRFDPLIYNENQKPSAKVATGPVITPAMLGKRVFTANCMTCHQATGQGVPGVYPSLVGSEWVLDPKHERDIIRIVLHGLKGPITVKGNNYNNVMTPFGSILKDEQIANVLTYVRSEWGNDAPAITAEQVAALRAEFSSRKDQWTVEELAK